MSVRFKILSGCLALTLLTGVVGLFAQAAERRLGAVAFDIYDNAFMAVSYLREAQIDCARLAAGARKGMPAPASADALSQDILDDLDVVRDRAMSPAGRDEAATLRRLFVSQQPRLAIDPGAGAALQRAFDRLVERFADDGFRYRRGVSRMVAAQIRRTWIAIGCSLLAAVAITALITRTIAPPIRRAVLIAQSIAAGRLDNPITAKGHGETAALLRALSTMQAGIAAGMARINALMAEQAESHATEIAVQHAQMQAALSNMNQGLCLFDEDGRLRVANPRFAELFGLPCLGARSDEVLRGAGLDAIIDASRDGAIAAFSCTLPDGRTIAVSQQAIASGGWVATYENVSERRAAEARLAHMARHDLLTGLPNRLLFSERIERLLAEDKPMPNDLAVLCLDIHRFKTINEMLGHGVADALLRALAQRLQGCVRKGDLVVHLGGDSFAIIQDASSPDAGAQPNAATMLAERIIKATAEPFEIEQHQIVVGASIGVALLQNAVSVQDRDVAGALLKRADLALSRARADGDGGFRFFEPEMDIRMQARRSLEQDLRRAAQENQFELFYQPLMRSSGDVAGFEALLRWRHPERGLVSPVLFIPLAEEIGLMPALGKMVLGLACADAAQWPSSLKVAVNLSPLQFRGCLADEVSEALLASGLAPRRLELEITESVLLQDDEKILETLHAIRDLGVRIAMDDFGTGYSSLGYLQRFPFDKIKIDQSFVRGMIERQDCLAIVRAVIGLGRSLGIAINAEGVETQAQQAMLVNEGCNELQGYLFSRPLPSASVPDMLRALDPISGRQAVDA